MASRMNRRNGQAVVGTFLLTARPAEGERFMAELLIKTGGQHAHEAIKKFHLKRINVSAFAVGHGFDHKLRGTIRHHEP